MPDQTIEAGLYITGPDIEKDGYHFRGWYLDNSFNNKAVFPYQVMSDTTLFAKWEEKVYYTVTFETNGGSDVENVRVEAGEEVLLPSTTKEDNTFLGWYLDSEFNTPVPSPFIPTSNITCYAKWESQFVLTYLSQLNVRYIRDWCGESYDGVNSPSWCGIQAFDENGVNIALNKPTTFYNYAGSGSYPVTAVTDANVFEYGNEFFPNKPGLNYVEIDLQQTYNIHSILVLHFPGRKYYNTRLQISEDGENWYSVSDWWVQGPYEEGPYPDCGVTYDLTTMPSLVEITYNTNGGSYVEKQYVPRGQSFIPNITTKENYKFTGWFKDPELKELYKYPTEGFLQDTTLYASFAYDRPGLLNRQKIRYIKSGLCNSGGWNSIKAFVGNVDVANGKKEILLNGSTNDPHNCIDNLTKGREGERYNRSYLYYPTYDGSSNVQIDLGQAYEIDHVMVYPRPDENYYNNTVYFCVSENGTDWYYIQRCDVDGVLRTSWKGELYSLADHYIIGSEPVDLNTIPVRYIRHRIGKKDDDVRIADVQAYVGDNNVALGKDIYENKGSYKELRPEWSALVDGDQNMNNAMVVKAKGEHPNTFVDLTVDLGQEYNLDRIYIKNGNSWSIRTIIEVSTDGEKWYELYNVYRTFRTTEETDNNGLTYTQVYVD